MKFALVKSIVKLVLIAAPAVCAAADHSQSIPAKESLYVGSIWSGFSLAASGDTILVGTFDKDAGHDSGAVYVLERNSNHWYYNTRLIPNDNAAGDQFGVSVSISGDVAVVGARYNDDQGGSSGSAYIYSRSDGYWTEQIKLTASDAAANDWFGHAVAVSGNTVAVSSHYDDDKGANSGSVYIFEKNQDTWLQTSKLVATDGTASDVFGHTLALSGDTLIIGSRQLNSAHGSPGSVYIFERGDAGWVQHSKLSASNKPESFGDSLALSGNTAVVGAVYDDSKGAYSGSAYVFERDESGDWIEQSKLNASDGAADDQFGSSVAIDGNSIVVGAQYEGEYGYYSGAAYVFSKTEDSWAQQTKLIANEGSSGDRFGFSTALTGKNVLVGAPWADYYQNDSGQVYSYDLVCSTPSHVLKDNQWNLISIPCQLPTNKNTVKGVFGDDGLGDYGHDWALFSYNPASNTYTQLGYDSQLLPSTGYWAIQASGSDKTLRLPENSFPTFINTKKSADYCDSQKGCISTSLFTAPDARRFQMLGNPFAGNIRLYSMRVTTNSETTPNNCANSYGCYLDSAENDSIMFGQFITYNVDWGAYTVLEENDVIQPWDGFWAMTMNGSHNTSPKLIFPQPYSDLE